MLFVLALIMTIQVCHVQTWREWFRQRKTQIKYLVNQISALKVYTDYLKKGYDIARDGTRLIKDIKDGDFNLHKGYFSSLKSVNPAIKNSSRVIDIISLQVKIIQRFKRLILYCNQSGQFTTDELRHVQSVYGNLIAKSGNQIDELVRLTTSGELEMKDDERIKRLEVIYLDMKDKYAFTQSYCNETSILAFSRISEKQEVDRSIILNGLR